MESLDLIIPVVLECHSMIHFDFIMIVVHAIDCLKRIRGDVELCCDELKELVAAKGQDELDELIVAKGHFELNELVVAKGHLIVRCHSFVGWFASRNATWFDPLVKSN